MAAADHKPSVSLLVAMRNEAAHIGPCLSSIAAQDYPPEQLEVWVLDGQSDDGTRAIAERIADGRAGWHVATNERRTQAAAWNQGIDRASGEIIGIVSGHAELAHDYVSQAVETLERTGAWMVGGPVRAISFGSTGMAIARALSTTFGVGGARFRYTEREEEVDTVFMGVCRADTYRAFRFDEAMVRDQDDELSYRLLDAGGRILCNPAIRSSYQSRGSLPDLCRQYFDYGRWKVEVMRRHPRQIRMRQLVPPTWVGLLLILGAMAPFAALARIGLIGAVGSYAVANLGASIAAGARQSRAVVVRLPAVYAVLHLSYGSGVLYGFGRSLLARRR